MASGKPAVHGLERLIEGNERFVAEVAESVGASRSSRFLSTQDPFAVILTCADARVVPELVFDQTIGRLFVIRVAGNVPGPEEIGSIEYAVDRFACPVVVVLGHTKCGAVALAMADNPDGWEPNRLVAASPSVQAIVNRVQESLDATADVEPQRAAGGSTSLDDAWRAAVVQNIRSAVEQLRTTSISMVAAASDRRTVVVGAIYDVETGRVDFLDE